MPDAFVFLLMVTVKNKDNKTESIQHLDGLLLEEKSHVKTFTWSAEVKEREVSLPTPNLFIEVTVNTVLLGSWVIVTQVIYLTLTHTHRGDSTAISHRDDWGSSPSPGG